MSNNITKPAILFVDDEELSRKYFKRFFGRDFEVHCAEDGDVGLETLLAHRDRIGILVTDQMMPRVTGLELLATVREQNIPVVRILSTAYADSVDVAAAVESGLIEFFVTKPWDLVGLEDTIAQAVSRWEALAEPAA